MAGDVEIFQDPQFAATFVPMLGGMTVKLDEVATKAIVDHYGGKHAKNRVFIMLTYEGGLDSNWPVETEWARVIRRVVESQVLVYNNRSKRCTRAVWHQSVAARTRTNFSWERVRLFPVERVIKDATLPANAQLIDNA